MTAVDDIMTDKEEIKKSSVSPNEGNTSGIAGEGDVVKVHYTGTLDDGEEFDSSKGKDPIEFVVGQHTVIKGFEDAVQGMKQGDSKQFKVAPEDAYGDPNPELKQTVPRDALGEDITPEEGMMLALQHPQMQQPMPAKVVEVGEKEVTLDLNHPLAGKSLNFEIELVEIK